MTKAEIRAAMLARRAALEPGEREARSAAIAERLYRTPAWAAARTVHAYVGIDAEVATGPILDAARAAGKRVACPRVVRRPPGLASHAIAGPGDLVEGPRGLLEPLAECALVEPGEIDLVLVPGLAFDRSGGRIGYGAGYYDRFLATTPAERVGLAFSLQVVDRVPREEHDVDVDRIVTEDETIDCRAERGREKGSR